MASDAIDDFTESVTSARLGEGFIIKQFGSASLSDRLDAAAKIVESRDRKRDAAAKLAVLEGLKALAERKNRNDANLGRCYREASLDLRAKYESEAKG